jgi:hypothetical protein
LFAYLQPLKNYLRILNGCKFPIACENGVVRIFGFLDTILCERYPQEALFFSTERVCQTCKSSKIGSFGRRDKKFYQKNVDHYICHHLAERVSIAASFCVVNFVANMTISIKVCYCTPKRRLFETYLAFG